MNSRAEAAVRLIYRHYATLLDGAPVEDPDEMVAAMGASLPWWGVKERKAKPLYNRLSGGMGLLADQDRLVVFLSPGHILPEWKREYTPTGRPAPSVQRQVMLSVKDGVVVVGRKKIPEDEARAFLAELKIPCAPYPSLKEMGTAILTGDISVRPPFVFVSKLTNSFPKCASAFGLSSAGSLHECMGIRSESRDSHCIRGSLIGYGKLSPEHRAILRDLLKTKQARDLPDPVRAWWARLPGTPADRQFIFHHISQGERYATE